MGTFNWPIRISSMDGERSVEIEATVDASVAYTTLPASFLRETGITPTGRRRFVSAYGQRDEMDVGRAQITIDGENVTTLVAFGEDEGPALLGAYTLNGLALAVDPVEQRLVPADLVMYQGR